MDMKQYVNDVAKKYKHIEDFQKNTKYSRENTTVYVAPDQKHWLAVELMDNNTIQARLTDGNGLVTQWDDYSIIDGKIELNASVKASERADKSLTERIEKAKTRADKNNKERADKRTKANEKGYTSH